VNLVRRVEVLEGRSLRVVNAEPVRVQTPQDVPALIEEQVNVIRAEIGVDPTERARTLGMLASLALRAIDSRDLAERLEAIERVLKLRKDKEREDAKRRNGNGR
jgi:hypothetical protein